MFDFIGVLILVALIAVFGFLAFRSSKARRRWLKWIGMLLAGLLTLIPAALLVLALIGFAKLNQHYDNPVADVKVAGTPEQIAHGERLANACASCHTPLNQLPLSGVNFGAKFDFPSMMGVIYAPNLTPSGNIRDWSDGEIIRAIREGINKDGRSLMIMPAGDFRNMSDEDVQAVVAYLRSQPATGDPTPKTSLSVIGAIFTNMTDFRTAQAPVGHISTPPAGTVEYGKYMVDVIGCRDCHGPQLQGRVDNGQLGPPAGPNLTHIVPQWTEEQFMTFFNTGTMPGGGQVPILTLNSGFSEPRMNWPMVRAVATDEDLKAMYAYLHGLQPIDEPAQ
jgi:mono/diheme cytochrome c family protein